MTNPYGQQYPQYGQYPVPQPQYQGYPMPPKNNGMAIASMILSLFSIVGCGFGLVLSLVGAILGHVSLSRIKKDPNATGTGMAMTGIIVGWLVFAVWIGLVTFIILGATGGLGPEWQNEFN